MYSFNFHHLPLLQSSDTEINPGPLKSSRVNFCHWNLNGNGNFFKAPLIEASTKANNIDIICLSVTFLDSTILVNDERLYIKGYSMIAADYSSCTKRGDVCLYYKEHLPLSRKIDVCKLNECAVTEIIVNKEICFLRCLYRSPNQNQEQFESFCENLIDVLSGINNQQPACSILVDKDSKAGQDIDTFTTTSGYTQIIGQPTHIVNDTLSCIDLLFTTYSKLLSDVGVKQTIYDKCHHNIIYRSINLYMPFLHLAVGKFGMTKTQIRYVYSMQHH